MRVRSLRRRHLLRVLLPAVLLGLLSLLFSACGAETTTSTTTPTTTSTSAAAATTSTAVPARVGKLTLVVPPGPMAVPAAYLAAEDKLSAVAESVEVITWENAEQLRALVAGNQADFVTMPSNNAAVFYNKGLGIQLLDIGVWNITYLISTQEGVASFAHIKGQSLTVSFQGSVPDLMFQTLAAREGLDPATDFSLRYAADPTQAAQLLLSGQVQNAVLSEALATSVLLQSKDKGINLYRSFSFDGGWEAAFGAEAGRTPIAGTAATARVLDKPEVIAEYRRQYKAAVEWMLANPEDAGKLVEEKLPQLGLKGAILTASLKNITWEYVEADQARPDIEAFFDTLGDLSLDVIGGKLPDDGFYYGAD